MCMSNCPAMQALSQCLCPTVFKEPRPTCTPLPMLSIYKKERKKATLNSAENSWWTKATQNTSENVTPFQNHRDCINLQENVCCRNNFQHASIELDVQFRGFIKKKKKKKGKKKVHMESRYHQTSIV